ncbi:AlbA family DNA-binding domain-containing protein [Spirosoma fluminis]
MAHSFAKDYFGKDIDGVTPQDLENFFSIERDESLTLEFKSFVQRENDFKHKEHAVLRTICAFLNSSGGLLIWGAPVTSKNKDGLKVCVGDLSPVERRYTKDDFVSKVAQNIRPFGAPMQFKEVKISHGLFVYLIDVPESESKPHQYEDRYFIRLDGQSKPAPHYVIDALFKQVRRPELKGYLRVVGFRFVFGEGYHDEHRIELKFDVTVFNESKNLNDSGVYVQIWASEGKFISSTDLPNYLFNGPLVFVQEVSPIITYGLSAQCSLDFELRSSEFSKFFTDSDSYLELNVTFGSSKSITRRSDYKIKFKNIPRSPGFDGRLYTREIDLLSLMSIEKEENISLNDYWQGSEEERRNMNLHGI